MDFSAWDIAIAARLDPIRQELASIPVAALPKEAGKFGENLQQSIDWLMPSYSSSDTPSFDKVQLASVSLVVRLYFAARYGSELERATLEWAESQVLSLLIGYELPESKSNIRLLSGRLFAPEQGQWYKELSFEFMASIIPRDEIEPLPEVVRVGVDDSEGGLIDVT